ncbi:M55 family metallopeptidase [Candidatus Bathyarchaeota archaeon]|nr:M55 family metallopeptidase [Candidatus Bathyarchaeota archaeon]
MKVYILTDLEGISYVVREEQTAPGTKEYEEACLLLTRDVNAAIEGAIDGGAKEIVVNDLHGARGGLIGLDESYNLAFMVGYHAMAGTLGAVLDHTMASKVIVNVYLNEQKVGEIGIDSSILGCFNIPVGLVTGCKKAVEEAKSLLGDVEGVIVKEGFSRNFAICMPPVKSRRLIRESARRAVERARKGEFRPFKVKPPIKVRVEYSHPNYADMQARMPGVERLDSRTILVEGENLLDVMLKLGWY